MMITRNKIWAKRIIGVLIGAVGSALIYQSYEEQGRFEMACGIANGTHGCDIRNQDGKAGSICFVPDESK